MADAPVTFAQTLSAPCHARVDHRQQPDAANAVANLDIGNEMLRFDARFSGASYAIFVPLRAVLGIYAQETGRGMIFSEEEAAPSAPEEPPPGSGGGAPAGDSRRAKLKLVK
jgi:stringent starvation protein B